jgi:hypothetical protein
VGRSFAVSEDSPGVWVADLINHRILAKPHDTPPSYPGPDEIVGAGHLHDVLKGWIEQEQDAKPDVTPNGALKLS